MAIKHKVFCLKYEERVPTSASSEDLEELLDDGWNIIEKFTPPISTGSSSVYVFSNVTLILQKES